MKVLVTGASGYVGGRLVSFLRACGQDVVAASRFASPGQGAVLLDWDSDASLQDACRGCEAVIHLAGMNAADCARDPLAALRFNALGTARLLDAAVRQGATRFLYVSTAHVYGASLAGVVDEHTPTEPRHPYGTTRRAAEDMVRLARGSGGILGIVVRLSNAFGVPLGPGEAACWSLFVNDLCRQAVLTRSVRLHTDGTPRRDFIPMSQVCRALGHLLQAHETALQDEVLNLGSGEALALYDMATIVIDRVEAGLGYRPTMTLGSKPDSSGSRLNTYRIDRLLSTGFSPDPNTRTLEIDELVRRCSLLS